MRALAPAAVILALVGCNEPPGAPVIGISPAEPTTLDALTVEILEDSVDPNKNDAVDYTYSWTVDGATVGDLTGTEVPADRTQRGQTWAVTVTPADDKLAGTAATASITILNATPSAEVSISPEAPLSTDDLIADITTEDPDGDTVNTQITWTKDGTDARISSERVPADRTRRGEVWEVTVVPKDARDTGEAVTASVQIANQAPTVESVRLRPELAYEASIIEVIIDANDNDGDGLTYAPTWSVNGVEITEVTVLSLDGAYFDKGDSVSVSIVASDGLADSAPQASEPVIIQNTPPRLSKVEITPPEAYEGDTLTCTPSGWSDDDGDPEDYRYEWRIDGTVVGSGTTLGSEVFGKGDRVSCTVYPNDGTEDGLAVSARPITIGNTAPEVASITIAPTDPMTGTTVTASVSGITDVDDDAVRLDIDWYVSGTKVASGASLPGTAYTRDKDIHAEVTPYDGTDYGPKVKSNVARSRNAPPQITSFALTPSAFYTDSTVSASIVTADPDFDTVTLTYAWTINGTPYGGSSTTSIPSTDVIVGDTIALTVTPNDGTVDGTSRSGSRKVVNAPPRGHEITVSPAKPKLEDDITCTITKLATDADGDDITYSIDWEQDGVLWTGDTSTTTRAGDTISGADTSSGEDWTCIVTADDGMDATEVEEEVTVGSDVVHYDYGYYWVRATYAASRTDHSSICSAQGLKATAATITISGSWTEAKMEAIAKAFGYTKRATGCCAASMWCFDSDKTCQTHSALSSTFNNYGTFGSSSLPVFSCTK